MTSSADSPYPNVEKPNFPAIENRILDRWKADGTFAQSISDRSPDQEFVFYDGPPFANGLPHHGHLLTGYVKDVVPRYQTMRGNRVDRRFGWDCHGLPAEMETEKQLGVSGRVAITEYGIEEFNEACRTSVQRYTEEWEQTVTRQARWVDFDNDYKTMDLDYMESVIWAFKQLWDKGLIYEANKVMPYSWAAETPLSNFEIRLDDATRPRQDRAVTVAFDLAPADGDPGPLRMLAWTTTPWTLPSNLGLIVGPDIDYAVVELDGAFYVLGEATLGTYAKQLENATQHSTVKGADLVGRTYAPILPYFAERGGADDLHAFRVMAGDFVDTAEGSGIVHTAPGFGEDDQRIATENGMGMVVPVDDQGRFTSEITDFAGMNVFEANPEIIKHLRDIDGVNRIFSDDSYMHNYPHCWRTDEPIIYRALPSWYVKVTDIRDRLVELNQQINWVPDNVRDGRFGKWLEGARDWSISRNRFWGSPIPVWQSDNPEFPRIDVYGSLDELEADFGVRPTNLHRPYIDELVRPNPDDPSGKSMMRRVPEVLDCWFESGSMPFAQAHYPFENKEWFDEHYPADFIVEYINQTRGWFYTLHVLAGALFDKPSFQNVICHGILLADDGAKLSKKLRNYTEPEEIFTKQGSDALRWYFMSSPIVRGGDARISDQGIDDVTRQVMLPIWNAYSFFTLYANIDGYQAKLSADSTQVLDRYILAKTRTMVEGATAAMDAYDLPGATSELFGFIDALNNWYIRRSRDRFWAPASDASDADKQAAYDTLYTVLTTFLRAAAPFLPLVTEEIYGGLMGGESVHLADWPDADSLPDDPELVASMDRVRDVVSTALRLREDAGLRVRLPLATLTVAGADTAALEPFAAIIADEVNVKTIEFSDDMAQFATFEFRPNSKVIGPKRGKDAKAIFAAFKSGDVSGSPADGVRAGGFELDDDEFELALVADDAVGGLRDGQSVVVLDTNITAELEAEGVARDVVRAIQNARKEADLVVTDRIDLWIDGPASVLAAVEAHRDYVTDQVLGASIALGDESPAEAFSSSGAVTGGDVSLGLRVANA